MTPSEPPTTEGASNLSRDQITRTAVTSVAILMMVFAIDFIDRVMMSVALPFIGADLDLTKIEQGALVTAFAVAYLITQIPGGVLADRYGPVRMLLIALCVWSLFTAATGLVGGLVAMIVVRVLFGAGQGLLPGAVFKAVAERVIPTQRASAGSGLLAACHIGGAIAPLIVAPIIMAAGWRITFVIVAAAGLLISVVLVRYLPRPLPSLLADAPSSDSRRTSIRDVLRSPSVWVFALLFCLLNMVTYGLMTWVPSYLLEVRGISLIGTGAASAIPFFALTAGTLLGGWLFDRHFHDRPRVMSIPLLVAAAVLLFFMATSRTVVEFTVYETLALSVVGLSYLSVLGMPLRSLPTAVVASGMATVNFGGQAAGALAPVTMGALVDEFSYPAAFGLLVGCAALAAVLAFFAPQGVGGFVLRAASKPNRA